MRIVFGLILFISLSLSNLLYAQTPGDILDEQIQIIKDQLEEVGSECLDSIINNCLPPGCEVDISTGIITCDTYFDTPYGEGSISVVKDILGGTTRIDGQACNGLGICEGSVLVSDEDLDVEDIYFTTKVLGVNPTVLVTPSGGITGQVNWECPRIAKIIGTSGGVIYGSGGIEGQGTATYNTTCGVNYISVGVGVTHTSNETNVRWGLQILR